MCLLRPLRQVFLPIVGNCETSANASLRITDIECADDLSVSLLPTFISSHDQHNLQSLKSLLIDMYRKAATRVSRECYQCQCICLSF
jgi:hypothetical protein